ncbi:hypothetical protein ABU552_003331 [Yersinia enterocolitica]
MKEEPAGTIKLIVPDLLQLELAVPAAVITRPSTLPDKAHVFLQLSPSSTCRFTVDTPPDAYTVMGLPVVLIAV